MEEIEVMSIRLSHLRNGNHLTLNILTLEMVSKDEWVSRELSKFIAQYEVAVEEEKRVMSRASFVEQTQQIADADRDRDTLYHVFNRVWRAYLHTPELAKRAAAEKIQAYWREKRVNTQAQYDRESGMMSTLIGDMRKFCAAEVELLGLTSILDQMAEKNDMVTELILRRNEMQVDERQIAVAQARKETDRCYLRLVKAINSWAFVFGPEKYEHLIGLLNENLKRTKREALKPRRKVKKEGKRDGGLEELS